MHVRTTTFERSQFIRTMYALSVAMTMFVALSMNPVHAQAATNLIPNGSLESADSSGLPTSWKKGGYGTNTRSLTYPVTGNGGGKATKTQITSYTSGDAKWYFTTVALSAGTYIYSDDYMSDITSHVTVQFQKTDGTFAWKDIAHPVASSAFTTMSREFVVPAGIANVTIFHLIKGVGFVTIDNASIVSTSTPPPPTDIFSTGAISLRFDDGTISQYQVALPKLNSAGLKGSFYIITRRLSDLGYSGYMSKQQITELYNAGNEINAHTRTHPDLSQLSAVQQQDEIAGSRQDLLSWNVGPILSFTPPFGVFNQTTLTTVRDAGFTSMTISDGGLNDATADRFHLARISADKRNTLAQLKQYVDQAATNKQWLTLTFHLIDNSGNTYSITPTDFNSIIDYVVQKGLPVVTISTGAATLQQ